MNRNNSLDELIANLKLIFTIGIGLYLFVLFFQPFGQIMPFLNEQLLFNAGLAGIIMVLMWFFRILLPTLYPSISEFEKFNLHSELLYFSIWAFSSVAFVFYIRYVGGIRMSFFLVFKIVIICFAATAALRSNDERNSMRIMLHALLDKNRNLSGQILQTAIKENPEEVFTSENKSEIVKLKTDSIVLIKSADNYVEIFYKEEEKVQQKLIRNTLKNIENQLKKHAQFIRCHRTCIINKKHVYDFKHDYAGYRLKLSGFSGDVPVSRQYLLAVKEAITTG
ncbi:MAG: LytTR family transcriptional regulator DNA-binding domain-containing protein [Bacteroidales bacterium]|nr:LytTR family transcriptional regulator DNA-binding domain-containing protein [Bacteroidales bacterium]